jgi:hypothetical protein
MSRQLHAEKASFLGGKARVSSLVIVLATVALALVVMLQGGKPATLPKTNFAQSAAGFPAAGPAPALPRPAEFASLRGLAAVRALDAATGSAVAFDAAHLRNVAAVRAADATVSGAGVAASYASLRGVAAARALDAANSRANASTAPHFRNVAAIRAVDAIVSPAIGHGALHLRNVAAVRTADAAQINATSARRGFRGVAAVRAAEF